MSLNRTHSILIVGWFASVSLLTMTAVLFGYSTSMSTAAFGAAVACIPPVIALMVFRGAPGRSMSEMIYDAEQTPVRVKQETR